MQACPSPDCGPKFCVGAKSFYTYLSLICLHQASARLHQSLANARRRLLGTLRLCNASLQYIYLAFFFSCFTDDWLEWMRILWLVLSVMPFNYSNYWFMFFAHVSSSTDYYHGCVCLAVFISYRLAITLWLPSLQLDAFMCGKLSAASSSYWHMRLPVVSLSL